MGCCGSLQSIPRDCLNNLGGIKRVWFHCFDDAGTPTVTTNQITALGVGTGWVEVEFKKETSNFEVTFNRDNANGSQYFSTVLSIVLNKLSTPNWVAIEQLAISDLVSIVEDNNGRFWYFGYDYYMQLSDGSTAATGTAFGDLNGYTLNFEDYGINRPYEVTTEAMQPIINPA